MRENRTDKLELGIVSSDGYIGIFHLCVSELPLELICLPNFGRKKR
jgi:hypothetical protein